MSSEVLTDARIEKIIQALPDDLADEWIDAIEDRGIDIGEAALTLAFWDAVRIALRVALRAQIVCGHGDPIDDEWTLERIEEQVLEQRIDADERF